MGLRCDVFGHDFGAPTIDEVREESDRGTLLVVREYETCRRCGAEHELSENRGLISQAPEPTDNATPSRESDGRQARTVEPSERRGATDKGSGTQTADGPPAGGQDATFPPPASEIPDGDGGSDGTYRCPRCEYEVPVSNASFCRGDVCPECHVGYIERVEKP